MGGSQGSKSRTCVIPLGPYSSPASQLCQLNGLGQWDVVNIGTGCWASVFGNLGPEKRRRG